MIPITSDKQIINEPSNLGFDDRVDLRTKALAVLGFRKSSLFHTIKHERVRCWISKVWNPPSTWGGFGGSWHLSRGFGWPDLLRQSNQGQTGGRNFLCSTPGFEWIKPSWLWIRGMSEAEGHAWRQIGSPQSIFLIRLVGFETWKGNTIVSTRVHESESYYQSCGRALINLAINW